MLAGLEAIQDEGHVELVRDADADAIDLAQLEHLAVIGEGVGDAVLAGGGLDGILADVAEGDDLGVGVRLEALDMVLAYADTYDGGSDLLGHVAFLPSGTIIGADIRAGKGRTCLRCSGGGNLKGTTAQRRPPQSTPRGHLARGYRSNRCLGS